MKKVSCKRKNNKEIEILDYTNPTLEQIEPESINEHYSGSIDSHELIEIGETIYLNFPDEKIDWMEANILSMDENGDIFTYWYGGKKIKNT